MISILCFKIKQNFKFLPTRNGRRYLSLCWAVPGAPTPSELITDNSHFCSLQFTTQSELLMTDVSMFLQIEIWKSASKEPRGRARFVWNVLRVPGALRNVTFHLHRYCEVSFTVFLIL